MQSPYITVSIIKSHVFQTDYKASDLSYSSSLLDSDPAKITSTIIGYSDIRLFDLPVSIKQRKRRQTYNSQPQKKTHSERFW